MSENRYRNNQMLIRLTKSEREKFEENFRKSNFSSRNDFIIHLILKNYREKELCYERK